MKNLGNIRLALACDKYQLQFQYATPQKIDFFALTLMEIIKRKQQFSEMKLFEVLLMLEIPNDLHNIFEDRIRTLICEKPEMINFGKKVDCFLENEVSLFDLTKIGEQSYISKEIIEETKKFQGDFIYDHLESQLTTIEKLKIQAEKEAIIVDTRPNECDKVLIEKFKKIISNNIIKYVPTGNNKTQILEMRIAPTNTMYLRDNIEVIIENDKLNFSHKSEVIKNAFLVLPESEKDSIREKMFFFLKLPNNKLNCEKSAILTKSNQPIKMKVCFGNKINCIEAFENGVFVCNEGDFYEVENTENYVFAGIKENGQSLIYRYTELTENGFTIPLYEEDYSFENYMKVFNEIYIHYKSFLTNKIKIKFILSIAPFEKKKEIIQDIAKINNNSNEIVNLLLSINESSTIEALSLVKLYNQLLEQDRIKTISHNSNLFAAYLGFNKQLGILKTLGFVNYYNYSVPKDWNEFRKEVLILKTLYDKLKDKLTEPYRNQVLDFFVKSEEDFYELAPIDEKIGKSLIISEDWRKDINKALNGNKPNFQAIAAVIRGKYEGQIRKFEKHKDAISNGSRKGKELIDFVLTDFEERKRVYNSWRILNALVHFEASQEHFIIKGTDKERKDAIIKAIYCFNQILDEKKENSINEKGNNNMQNKKKNK